jgi:hypothetical protein
LTSVELGLTVDEDERLDLWDNSNSIFYGEWVFGVFAGGFGGNGCFGGGFLMVNVWWIVVISW